MARRKSSHAVPFKPRHLELLIFFSTYISIQPHVVFQPECKADEGVIQLRSPSILLTSEANTSLPFPLKPRAPNRHWRLCPLPYACHSTPRVVVTMDAFLAFSGYGFVYKWHMFTPSQQSSATANESETILLRCQLIRDKGICMFANRN